MDDLHSVAERDRAIWQSEAEQRADRQPARWRRPVLIGLGVTAAIAVITAGVTYWLHARHFESTDDAFVDGYVTQMAPQVAGRVTSLKFVDNEHVQAGQTLVLIDSRDYRVRLDQAKAQRGN